MGWLRSSKEGALLTCRVLPSSSRNEIAGVSGTALRIKITAPPVDGKANRAFLAFLAKKLKVPKNRVIILKGTTGRLKEILLVGITAEEIEKILGENK